MSDLVVISFDDEHRGFLVRDAMANMQKERLASLQDAAVAVRGEDGRVSIHQTANLVKAGAFGGAFWGFLVGLIFSVPFFGTAISAAAGALAGACSESGASDSSTPHSCSWRCLRARGAFVPTTLWGSSILRLTIRTRQRS